MRINTDKNQKEEKVMKGIKNVLVVLGIVIAVTFLCFNKVFAMSWEEFQDFHESKGLICPSYEYYETTAKTLGWTTPAKQSTLSPSSTSTSTSSRAYKDVRRALIDVAQRYFDDDKMSKSVAKREMIDIIQDYFDQPALSESYIITKKAMIDSIQRYFDDEISKTELMIELVDIVQSYYDQPALPTTEIEETSDYEELAQEVLKVYQEKEDEREKTEPGLVTEQLKGGK